MKKSILSFVAHPDDAELSLGGSLAKFAQEGFRIHIVVATDGTSGTLDPEKQDLSEIRQKEAQNGALILGVGNTIFLDYQDFGLDLLPSGELRRWFIKIIRELKPWIVFSQDPFGEPEIHPDHRAVAFAASDALNFSGLPRVESDQLREGLSPWFVPEKYYYNPKREGVNRILDITDTLEIKIKALLAHKSQVDFLVKDILFQLKQAGLEMEDLNQFISNKVSEGNPTLKDNGTFDPAGLISWAVKREAEQTGRAAGFSYGEAFRYVRFHPDRKSVV